VQGLVQLMPTYLAISQTPSGFDIRAVTAASRDGAAQAIKTALAQGLSVNAGQRELIQIGLLDLAAFGTLTPNADGAQATINYTNQAQAAIADLSTLTVTSIAQANTAIQTIRTAFNTLLAELRALGVIAP